MLSSVAALLNVQHYGSLPCNRAMRWIGVDTSIIRFSYEVPEIDTDPISLGRIGRAWSLIVASLLYTGYKAVFIFGNCALSPYVTLHWAG